MTGGHDGIIGMKADISIDRQIRQSKGERMQPADGDLRLQGAVVEVDVKTGLALDIKRVDVPYERVLQGEFKRK
jgi:calcineurin-like phosphoesterase